MIKDMLGYEIRIGDKVAFAMGYRGDKSLFYGKVESVDCDREVVLIRNNETDSPLSRKCSDVIKAF